MKLLMALTLILIGILFSLFSLSDIFEYIFSDKYIFGTEVGGWKYSSEGAFLTFNLLLVLAGVLLALFGIKLTRKNR